MGTFELAAVGFAGSSVGTALAIPMVWPRTPRPADVRFMGAWLLAGSAVVALISARVIGLLPPAAAVEHTINLIGFCAYPLLYLCIRAQSAPGRVHGTWWLWVPAAVYLVVLLVRGSLGGDTRVPFIWLLPVLIAFTGACATLVWRRPTLPTTAMVPARFIVGFLAVLNVAQFIRMQFGHVAPIRSLVPLVMTGGFVALVGLIIWRALDWRGASEPAKVTASDGPRYEKSGLERETAVALLATIERALAADRLFADADLTLGRLAAAVGSTPHQVSEVLNRHAAVTFHELVNRYRVAEVKTALSDPASDRFTIEGIGATAGFGSRSALYAAFRRLESVTPTEFRARARTQTATK